MVPFELHLDLDSDEIITLNFLPLTLSLNRELIFESCDAIFHHIFVQLNFVLGPLFEVSESFCLSVCERLKIL